MGKPFKMKGHTLPGINQRSDTNLPDGRPASAALQYKSPAKEVTHGSGKDWEHGHKERPAHQNTPEAHGVTYTSPAKDTRTLGKEEVVKRDSDPTAKVKDHFQKTKKTVAPSKIETLSAKHIPVSDEEVKLPKANYLNAIIK